MLREELGLLELELLAWWILLVPAPASPGPNAQSPPPLLPPARGEPAGEPAGVLVGERTGDGASSGVCNCDLAGELALGGDPRPDGLRGMRRSLAYKLIQSSLVYCLLCRLDGGISRCPDDCLGVRSE